MAFFLAAPLIPLGFGVAKIYRNLTPDERDLGSDAHGKRSSGVLSRLQAGGDSSPLSQWSEKHLERMIKRNSVFQANADELRAAHSSMKSGKGKDSAADSDAPPAPQFNEQHLERMIKRNSVFQPGTNVTSTAVPSTSK